MAVPQEDGCVQDIRTEDTFGYLEFHFEWKVLAGGNSGVKYLVQRTDSWQRNGYHARARGPEYQLGGESGALYSVLAPQTDVAVALGEFNRSRLVVHEARVQHWLNEALVLEYALSDPKVTPLPRTRGDRGPSPICLQHHCR